MKKFRIFLIVLVIILSSLFFYLLKQRDNTFIANNKAEALRIAKNKEIEDLRNRPFPLVGMENLKNTPPYIWKTFADKVQGITFSYPEKLLTTYIHETEWPPQVTLKNGTFVCNETGGDITSQGKTEKVTIGSHLYCVTTINDGAAGSIYTTYTYKTLLYNKIATITFTLQASQCANYDNPQKTECEIERNTFNVENFIDQITTSISFIPTTIPKINSGISGVVLLGPTCPVMRNPPDPACADRLYATNLILTTKDSSQAIKEFRSDANGNFMVEIAPGDYMIQKAPSTNMLPRCSSNEIIQVVSDQFASTTIFCDSGIR